MDFSGSSDSVALFFAVESASAFMLRFLLVIVPLPNHEEDVFQIGRGFNLFNVLKSLIERNHLGIFLVVVINYLDELVWRDFQVYEVLEQFFLLL